MAKHLSVHSMSSMSPQELSHIEELNVQARDFSLPEFHEFITGLSQCKQIDVLDVDINPEDVKGFEALMGAVSHAGIKKLIARSDNYSPEIQAHLASFIQGNNSLVNLTLMTTHHWMMMRMFKKDRVSIDLSVLEPALTNSSLQALTCSYVDISEPSAEVLCRVLPTLSLKVLNMSGNVSSLETVLGSIPDSLFCLEVSNNYLSSEARGALAQLMQRCHIKDLTLEAAGLDRSDFEELAKSFKDHAPVSLNVSNNIMLGSAFLEDALEKDDAAREFFAKYRFMERETSGMVIAEMLRNCPQIETFFARNCNISAKDVKYIARALPESGIKWLGLIHNPIGNDGAACIASVLNHTSINNLNLSDCNIGPCGALPLFSVLGDNKTLRLLMMRNKGLEFTTSGVFDTLVPSLKKNNTLAQLDMHCGNSPLNKYQWSSLDDLEENNTTLTFEFIDQIGRSNSLNERLENFSNRNMKKMIASFHAANAGTDVDVCSSEAAAKSTVVEPVELKEEVQEVSKAPAASPVRDKSPTWAQQFSPTARRKPECWMHAKERNEHNAARRHGKH